jgi:hypothetical protein
MGRIENASTNTDSTAGSGPSLAPTISSSELYPPFLSFISPTSRHIPHVAAPSGKFSQDGSAVEPNWLCARPTPIFTSPDVKTEGPSEEARETVS